MYNKMKKNESSYRSESKMIVFFKTNNNKVKHDL